MVKKHNEDYKEVMIASRCFYGDRKSFKEKCAREGKSCQEIINKLTRYWVLGRIKI